VDKSPDAFRTISEVADDLDLPQHVLRFWESRFAQIKPLKRGGGRRYYRPDDVLLLRGIKHLLYGEGYTIKGVQRILKEQGLRYVMAIWREDVPQASTGETPPGHEAYAPKAERGADRLEPLFDEDAPPVSYAPGRGHLPVARVAELAARRPNFEPIIDSADQPDEPEEPQPLDGGSEPEPAVHDVPGHRSPFSDGSRKRLEAALRELTELRHVLDAAL